MKPTPTQLKRIAELLSQPADDVDTLAADAWALVTELQTSRDQWIVVAWHPSVQLLTAVGPYATLNQAVKDAPTRIIDTGGTQARAALLHDPDQIDTSGQMVLDDISKRKRK